MSQIVRVNRKIQFASDAQHQANVSGNLDPERMCSIDWFDQTALDTTNDYTATLGGNNDAVGLNASGINGLKMTTGDGDNEISFLGTALIFDISNEPEIATRVKIADVSGTVFFFGFSDANTETTPAATIDYADATLAAAATDACGFVVDADKGTSSIYCASIATGGSVAATDSGLDWTDNQVKELRIKIDSSGNVTWYVDNAPVFYKATAVTDVPLCAIYNWGVRANDGTNYVYAYYLKKWQNITALA